MQVVYTSSSGTIKSANKFYNKLNSQIEITSIDDSKLNLCDGDLSISTHKFSFTPINEIVNKNNNSLIDLFGIIIYVDPTSIIRRYETEIHRRSLDSIDLSTSTINVTLWEKIVQNEGA